MKILLALSLLLYLDSVFSLADMFTCPTFAKCPDTHYVEYSGRNMLTATCQCIKKEQKREPSFCLQVILSCEKYDECSTMESVCSLTEIINACDKGVLTKFPVLCDKANQKLRKEKKAGAQKQCEGFKNKCNSGIRGECINAGNVCDPDTIIQLCKDKRITEKDTCEEAERQKDKDRTEDQKYYCRELQEDCLTNIVRNACRKISKICDIEIATMWCYKYDTSDIDRLSDIKCSDVVKKTQYLMFGESKPECWTQLPLCEKGDSKACMQVGTFCVKEIVSALCHANKIADKRICTYAGSEKTASPSYPGCQFFKDKCGDREDEYCQLASRYCDKDYIGFLCGFGMVKDLSICKNMPDGSVYYNRLINGSIPMDVFDR